MQSFKNVYYFSCFMLLTICLACSKSDPQMDMDLLQGPDTTKGMELTGVFMSAAHPTSGTAVVNKQHTLLTLTNFKTDAGPVLEFYLATDLTASNYISLGMLKGLDGNYTYDLPNSINFGTYKYLMVWCVDFKVNFGHAILE